MTRLERDVVVWSSAATTLTGIGYLWLKYFVEPPEPWSVVNHPLQPWLLKAHILVAPALVLGIGMIAVRHIWRHYRERGRFARKSGLLGALSVIPMIATGYLIQSVTAEPLLRIMALSHIALSVAYAVGLAAHYSITRRGRPRAPVPPAPHRIRIPASRTHRKR